MTPRSEPGSLYMLVFFFPTFCIQKCSCGFALPGLEREVGSVFQSLVELPRVCSLLSWLATPGVPGTAVCRQHGAAVSPGPAPPECTHPLPVYPTPVRYCSNSFLGGLRGRGSGAWQHRGWRAHSHSAHVFILSTGLQYGLTDKVWGNREIQVCVLDLPLFSCVALGTSL